MRIGYWLGPDDPNLPLPVATSIQIDPEFLQKFQTILDTIRSTYLKKLFPLVSPFENASMCSYLGDSTCRICRCNNGDSDITLKNSGREYTFPDGLIHYYKVHGVVPDPPDFVDFIKNFELVEKPYLEWQRAEVNARMICINNYSPAGIFTI